MKKRVNISLDEDLHKIASLYARANHTDFSSFLEDLLRQSVQTEQILPVKGEQKPQEVSIPMLGYINAGKPACDGPTELKKTITVPAIILNGYASAKDNLFALLVAGDSMEPTIKNGDILFFCKGLIPRDNQIVAALIDNKVTLKRLFHKGKKPFLKADNPKYKDIEPAEELIIQGVMIARMGRQKE